MVNANNNDHFSCLKLQGPSYFQLIVSALCHVTVCWHSKELVLTDSLCGDGAAFAKWNNLRFTWRSSNCRHLPFKGLNQHKISLVNTMERNSRCLQGNILCLVSPGDVIFSAVSLVCASGDRCQSTPIIDSFDSSRKMSLTFVLWQTFCNIHLVEQNWEEGQWPSPQWPLSPGS